MWFLKLRTYWQEKKLIKETAVTVRQLVEVRDMLKVLSEKIKSTANEKHKTDFIKLYSNMEKLEKALVEQADCLTDLRRYNRNCLVLGTVPNLKNITRADVFEAIAMLDSKEPA